MHLDYKPKNLLYVPDQNSWKLIDFDGVELMVDSDQQTNFDANYCKSAKYKIHSVQYKSPEVSRKTAEVNKYSKKIDIIINK